MSLIVVTEGQQPVGILTERDVSRLLLDYPGFFAVAVDEVVEALPSHRPYRPALGIDYALAAIAELRGLRFDPEAVDACLALFRENGYSLQSHLQEQAGLQKER